MTWQPIETAPKDGSWVLVCAGRNVWIAQWATPKTHADSSISGWRAGHTYTDGVTHWMPLPEPPSLP